MALTGRPGRALLRVLGADASDASDADGLGELSRQVHRNMHDPLAHEERLLWPLGWMVFERSPSDAYVAAADLVEKGRVDDAEELLCAAWNADRRRSCAVRCTRSRTGAGSSRAEGWNSPMRRRPPRGGVRSRALRPATSQFG